MGKARRWGIGSSARKEGKLEGEWGELALLPGKWGSSRRGGIRIFCWESGEARGERGIGSSAGKVGKLKEWVESALLPGKWGSARRVGNRLFCRESGEAPGECGIGSSAMQESGEVRGMGGICSSARKVGKRG